MIKYDYKINRLNEKRVFKPIPQYTDLQNYSVIRGKNAIGKSTLLHLIAYSFYGYDHRSYKGKFHQINDILRDKVSQFNEKKDQTLDFEMVIEDARDGTKICSKKESGDDLPRVYEIDKAGSKVDLNYEKFAQKYCVIYDIPDKPTDRISNMVGDVKAINMSLIERMDRFSEFLSKTNSDISNSHDPNKIRKLENMINEFEVALDTLADKRADLEETTKLIDLLTIKDAYYEVKKKINELEIRLEELKDKKSHNRKENKTRAEIKSKIRSSYQEFQNFMRRALHDSAQVKDISSTEQYESFKYCFENLTLKDWNWIKDVHDMLLEYKEFLDNTFSKYSFNDKVVNILEQLLQTLGELHRTGEKIPDFNIPKIMNSVKGLVSKHELDKNTAKNIKSAIFHTENALKHLEDFVSFIEDFGEDSSAMYDDNEAEVIYDYTYLIRSVKDDLERYTKTKDNLVHKMGQNGIDADNEDSIAHVIRSAYPTKFKQYSNKSSVELKREREEVTSCVSRNELNKKEIEADLYVTKRDLDLMRNRKTHPMLSKQKAIQDLFDKMISLKRIVSHFNDYFDILRDHNKPITSQLQFYNSCISKYFAKKLGQIPYIDKHVEVQEVDYLNRRFILSGSGTEVKFDYFSTGQAQCIYIQSLLNQQMERKVILLLDEISSMDEDTRHIIYDVIKAKRETGYLLAAILAEMSNDKPSVEVI